MVTDSRARFSSPSSSGRRERRARDVARGGLPPRGRVMDNRWIQVREASDVMGAPGFNWREEIATGQNTLSGTRLDFKSDYHRFDVRKAFFPFIHVESRTANNTPKRNQARPRVS